MEQQNLYRQLKATVEKHHFLGERVKERGHFLQSLKNTVNISNLIIIITTFIKLPSTKKISEMVPVLEISFIHYFKYNCRLYK